MRDLIKIFLVGVIMFFAPYAMSAEKYRVLVLPDNIVTDTAAVDSYIYDAAAEFFSSEVINILNRTDYINCPTVSDERQLLKSNPSYMIPARNVTTKYKSSYNIDYPQLKKVAAASNSRYVLLLTSSLDAENYILRRTVWDFLNIPGATVVDPAYKISTYASLVDTKNNTVLWSNTFYKTISVVENRILTRGPSPQTEQLQKIRDYSRMLCPEIAENVQVSILPADVLAKESHRVYYDMANFDNVFTKKYRRWRKEGQKDYEGFKKNTGEAVDTAKQKVNDTKQHIEEKRKERAERKVEAQAKKAEKAKLEAEKKAAETVNEAAPALDKSTKIIQPLDVDKEQTLFEPPDIRKHRRNRLFGEYDPTQPPLRDYDKL